MSGEKPTATEKRLKERQARLAATGEEGSAVISGEDALEAVSDLEGKGCIPPSPESWKTVK